MSFHRAFVLCAPLLLASASVAIARPPSPDAAINGLTLDHFLDRQTGRIMAADTDGDGRVSRAELDAMTTKGARDPSRLFDAMDANHDGYLDKAEVQAALTRRFRRMDRNGDGLLAPDERMAGKMRRGQAKTADAPATQP